MIIFKAIFIFILGTIVGSFVNVLVDRGQKGKSLLGRSKCDHCGYKLKWFDNVPVVSFLMIGGRCRKCRKKLSRQYPIVEFSMGLLFLLMAYSTGYFKPIDYSSDLLVFGDMVNLGYFLIVGFLFLAIFLWDYKYMIIPDGLVISGLIISVLYSSYKYFNSACSLFDPSCHFTANLLGALIVSGFFYLMYYYSKGRWIGGGDVKLGFWLGWIVGWQQVYFFLVFSYVLGSIVALILLAKHKKKMNSQIPFGPFLILSTLIIMVWGENIWWWWKAVVY